MIEVARRGGTVDGRRAMRITTLSPWPRDPPDWSLLPGGLRKVEWIVELPPGQDGLDRFFSAHAIAYGAADVGVTDGHRAAANALDVEVSAEVLDAMLQTLKFLD